MVSRKKIYGQKKFRCNLPKINFFFRVTSAPLNLSLKWKIKKKSFYRNSPTFYLRKKSSFYKANIRALRATMCSNILIFIQLNANTGLGAVCETVLRTKKIKLKILNKKVELATKKFC